jgi:hypothetical protein
MRLSSKKDPPLPREERQEDSNSLVDLLMNDPMARREFLDNHERMPLCAKAVFHVRQWWSDLFC